MSASSPPKSPKMSTHKRDTLVEQYSHRDDEHGAIQLQRVVLISIDPNSAEYVLNWALDNFIRPESDLVYKYIYIYIYGGMDWMDGWRKEGWDLYIFNNNKYYVLYNSIYF